MDPLLLRLSSHFKWHAYLQQRSTLPTSPLPLEMWVLLGATEYGDPPNAPTPIPVAAPAVYKEGMRKTADA